MNILILEDEQRAGEKLTDLINRLVPDATIDWHRSVADGIKHLSNDTSPTDLIFSDIELLDGNSFEIYDAVQPHCPIIFCTAYDKFYVEAFNTNGIAYLLKPYTEEQVREAWAKYELLFKVKKEKNSIISSDLISEFKMLVGNYQQTFKSTFSVKKKGGVFLLKIEEIAYFQAQGDFVLAIDKSNKKHILNYTLSGLEDVINPQQFFRINRSEIINIESILKYNPYTKNRLVIDLSSPNVALYTTNSRTPEFRSWVEGQ